MKLLGHINYELYGGKIKGVFDFNVSLVSKENKRISIQLSGEPCNNPVILRRVALQYWLVDAIIIWERPDLASLQYFNSFHQINEDHP